MDILQKVKTNRTVIYGAGNIARLAIIYLKNFMDSFERYVMGCAVSSDKKISNNHLENVPIKIIDDYMDYKEECFVLIAANPRFYPEIEAELRNRGFKNYDYFDCERYVDVMENLWKDSNCKRSHLFQENLARNLIEDEEYYAFLSKQLKTTLDFEVNVADHCNLNCQSCNHFSPLAKETFLEVGRLEKDLQRMNLLYGKNIGHVMLLGGEPLLHPRISTILKVSRDCLPDAFINLVTNGILLSKMDEKFWNLMRDLRISLSVTVYPIGFDYEKYETKAHRYGIKHNFDHSSLKGRKEAVKTTYIMPIKDNPTFSPYQMYAKCAHANFCVVLREGRLYNCSFAANVHHYNYYFHKNIPANEEVSIDIHNNEVNEIDEFLKFPNKMCAHCDICGYKYDIPWAVSKKEAYEWMGEKIQL